MVKLYCSHPLLDDTCLFAIVSHRREDGPQGLEAHGNVQQMSSKEEVIVMSQDRHGGVPDQVEERLEMKGKMLLSWNNLPNVVKFEPYSRCRSSQPPFSRCGTWYQLSSTCN